MNSYLLDYIKMNTRYQGNEDLCEDFLSEASRRTLALTENVDDIKFMEPYIKKVVNTSILTVLKNSGRVRRVNKSYVSVPPAVSLDMASSKANEHARFTLEDIPDPCANFTEAAANREILGQVCKAVAAADSKNPDKKYYDIFTKRYIDAKKQAEIAEDLGISQSEVCKRLYEIVRIVKTDVTGY